MSRAPSGGRRMAFTLVEILVVIAIITSLVALLLPVIARARQAAGALVCPVALSRLDGGVQLVDPGGRAELDAAPPKTLGMNTHPQGPLWSTNGSWVGYFSYNGSILDYVGIYKPSTGKTTRCVPGLVGSHFYGWADDGHFMTGGAVTEATMIQLRDAESGRVTQTLYSPCNVTGTIAPAPPSSGGAYVTAVHDREGVAIVLLKKDFTRHKTLWLDRTTPRNSYPEPRADSFGENVAWTMHMQGGGLGPVVIKPVREPSTVPPSVIVLDGTFDDWTEDGKLMVYLPGTDGARLSIIDTTGKYIGPVRGTDALINSYSGTASWRKYLRR